MPDVGLCLDKSLRVTNWDAFGAHATDPALLQYAALDAAVSYCAHMRLADMEQAEAQRLQHTPENGPSSGSSGGATDACQLWQCAEICDTTGNIVAVVDRSELSVPSPPGSSFVVANLKSIDVMVPAAKVMLTEKPTSEGISMCDLAAWRQAVEKAKEAAPASSYQALTNADEVSLHDVFEVAKLAKRSSFVFHIHSSRLRRGFRGIAYAPCLRPLPEGEMKVLLDIFHAEQRLTQGLNKQHCYFQEYLALIRDCFLRVDQDEFNRLVLAEAEKRQQDPERVEYDLLHLEWRVVRRMLPTHVPSREELEKGLRRIEAIARTMDDPTHGPLLPKTFKVRRAFCAFICIVAPVSDVMARLIHMLLSFLSRALRTC